MRLVAALLTLALSVPAATALGEPDAGASAWCAPELDVMGDGMCAYAPPGDAASRTLVIFLHGVIKPDTTWQYAQERAIVRGAKRLGFTVLTPRGRRGIGPKGMQDWWTWPTSVKAEHEIEADVLAEWSRARETLETKNGHAFEHVYVVGFSNGAYYATALALRGKLDVNGYAVFAGGAGAKYLTGPAAHVRRRPPIYVGYGLKDPAHKDPAGLGRALEELHWKHKVHGRRGVGHTMTDAGLDEAFRFFRGG